MFFSVQMTTFRCSSPKRHFTDRFPCMIHLKSTFLLTSLWRVRVTESCRCWPTHCRAHGSRDRPPGATPTFLAPWHGTWYIQSCGIFSVNGTITVSEQQVQSQQRQATKSGPQNTVCVSHRGKNTCNFSTNNGLVPRRTLHDTPYCTPIWQHWPHVTHLTDTLWQILWTWHDSTSYCVHSSHHWTHTHTHKRRVCC